MTGVFDGDDHATPLTPEEREGLRQSWITDHRELDEAEQANIALGEAWAFRQRRRDILDDDFVLALHQRMFGNVWRWAGAYRTTNRNLGIEPHRIAPETRQLLGDVRFGLEHQAYPSDETAVRLHHRLVLVHPFANGNGRHTRLMADLLIVRLGRPRFTWGRTSLVLPGEARARYVEALHTADANDMAPLLAFARS